MNKIRLSEKSTINLLYKQFKNQSLTNEERFLYAKLLIEKCISQIIIYPNNHVDMYLDLSTIVCNSNIKMFVADLVSNIDMESIIILNSRVSSQTINQIEDNKLLQRLATLLFSLINNDLAIIKKNRNIDLEKLILCEIETIRNNMENFINYESEIEKLDSELSELNSIFQFSTDVKIKVQIDEISDELVKLKSLDTFTNQKRLDDLEIHLNNAKSQKLSTIEGNVNMISNYNLTQNLSQNQDFLSQSNLVDIAIKVNKLTDVHLLSSSSLFAEFNSLYRCGNTLKTLEKNLNNLRIDYLNINRFPQYVFKENIIKSILFYLPENDKELLRIKGIGQTISNSIGDRIKSIIVSGLDTSQNLREYKLKIKDKYF